MIEIRTDKDGWDLENPGLEPLKEFLDAHDGMAKDIYELKNCVRTQSLQEMKESLQEEVRKMQDALDEIDETTVLVGVTECDMCEGNGEIGGPHPGCDEFEPPVVCPKCQEWCENNEL